MGPPPFGDGKSSENLTVVNALEWLQWGHRLSAMESAFLRPRKGSCLYKLQWGHRLSAMESTGESSSIVHVFVLQWGHRLSAMESRTNLAPCSHRVSYASMGPPPFGDGKCPAIGWRSTGWPCFNGATAFRRWKEGRPIDDGADASLLQWGHRLSAMESMQEHTERIVEAPLQWGHRLSAMESLQGRRRLLGRQSSFNGATAFRRWKGRPLVG